MVEVLLCSDLCSHRSLWRFTERLTGQQSTTNGNQRRGWLPSVGFSLYPSLKYILFFFSCPSFFSLAPILPPSLPLPLPSSLLPPSLPPSFLHYSLLPFSPHSLSPFSFPRFLHYSLLPSLLSLLPSLPLSFPSSLPPSAPQRYDPGFNYDSEPEELNNRSVHTYFFMHVHKYRMQQPSWHTAY